MDKSYIVAVDGPSGAGKSTIAQELAKSLDIAYIDTGAMYRACALYLSERGVENFSSTTDIVKYLSDIKIKLEPGRVLLNGRDVSKLIRTGEISRLASDISAIKEVRDILVEMQREMGKKESVVMDGRDIGTNVFPDADYKIFLVASLEERAKRRYKELLERGENADLSQVKEDMRQRDHNDSTRKYNPLKQAEDAILIDSTGMGINQVVDKILKIIKER